MPQQIHIQDLSSNKYRILVLLGIVFLLIAAISWYFGSEPIIYYASATVAIGCFFAISSSTFTTSNNISVDRYGATLKLVGDKTYGFRFSDISTLDLSDRGLLIALREMEDVKLSRKRYKEESLHQIYKLLQSKTQQL
ncbi:MAG: hypothetical protein WBG46_07745 [Nonlabens sp.]